MLYVQQADLILRIQPMVAILEQTANAVVINDGTEVKLLMDQLSQMYTIHHKIVQVWRHGDPSNRQRLFIIAIHNSLGSRAKQFNFPQGLYDSRRYPTAMDIAEPDERVPPEYIRKERPVERYNWQEPIPGKIHHLGNFGPGAGDSATPHPLQSWYGLCNTQLTTNGGARRVMMDWVKSDEIENTRLTIPIETIRIASLSDSYLTWVRKFSTDDEFMRKCVNNGVPLRTSSVIDECVIQFLEDSKVPRDVPSSDTGQEMRSMASQSNRGPDVESKHGSVIRSMLVDTGASGSLNFMDIEENLSGAVDSEYTIAVANNSRMRGSLDGKLNIHVLNIGGYKGVSTATPFSFNTTTTKELRTELFSIDQLYRSGNWNLLLRQPDFENGMNELYRAPRDGQPAIHIPLRYDYRGSGGWYLDYVIGGNLDEESRVAHSLLMMRHHDDLSEFHSEARVADVMRNSYTEEASKGFIKEIMANHDVVERTVIGTPETGPNGPIIIARHRDEKSVKGVKLNMKKDKQKISFMEFHRKYGHLGLASDKACDVCRMVKGSCRRIMKKHVPYKETRVGFAFSLDMVTFSHRSMQGSKYGMIFRCMATGYLAILPLYMKSDAPDALVTWVTRLRNDPLYSDLSKTSGYHMVSIIYTDEPGEWCRTSANWNAALLQLGHIRCIHVCPDTHREAGHAERSVGIVEETTKAILMEQNLSEDHWELAAANAVWLLNRFPSMAADTAYTSVDGDRMLSIEHLSCGRYSRKQVQRELNYFLQLGTPALVHVPSMRGSTLASKVRWGIAWAMYFEQVVFIDPFTRSTFRSKSYTAFELKNGINYAQFLGLTKMPTTRKAAALPGDGNEKIDVTLLPPVVRSGAQQVPPVVRLQYGTETGVKTLDIPTGASGGGADESQGIAETDPEFRGRVEDNSECEIGQNNECDESSIPSKSGWYPGEFDTSILPRMEKDSDSELGQKARDDQYPMGNLAPESMMDVDQPNQQHMQENHTLEADYNYDSDEEDQKALDSIAELLSWKEAIVVGVNQSFEKVCKKHSIPYELHGLYHKWLMSLKRDNEEPWFNEEILPPSGARGRYCKTGIKVPAPCGKEWRRMMVENGITRGGTNKMNCIKANEIVIQRLMCLEKEKERMLTSFINAPSQVQESSEMIKAMVAKKKETKSNLEGKTEPRTISEALRQSDRVEAFQWLDAVNKEIEGLTTMGVVKHNCTMAEIRSAGITTHPLPMSVVLNFKFDSDGKIAKRKVRMTIAGHPGAVTKGIHYQETYSATPVQHTNRLLQAIMVLNRWKRLTLDVRQAFLNADLEEGRKFAVRYPSGLRRYDNQGREMHMILLKNCYGLPQASRSWSQHRDEELLKVFNVSESGVKWKIHKCLKDPCLFKVTMESKGKNHTALFQAHVDDLDCIGSSDEILEGIFTIVNKRWKSERTDDSYCLGVKRTVVETQEEMTVELTQTASIEGLATSFPQSVSQKRVRTPLPEKLRLCELPDTNDLKRDEESKEVIALGYQKKSALFCGPPAVVSLLDHHGLGRSKSVCNNYCAS